MNCSRRKASKSLSSSNSTISTYGMPFTRRPVILWVIAACEEYAIRVVRLGFVIYKATFHDELGYTRLESGLRRPLQRFANRLPYGAGTAQPAHHFLQRS